MKYTCCSRLTRLMSGRVTERIYESCGAKRANNPCAGMASKQWRCNANCEYFSIQRSVETRIRCNFKHVRSGFWKLWNHPDTVFVDRAVPRAKILILLKCASERSNYISAENSVELETQWNSANFKSYSIDCRINELQGNVLVVISAIFEGN